MVGSEIKPSQTSTNCHSFDDDNNAMTEEAMNTVRQSLQKKIDNWLASSKAGENAVYLLDRKSVV